MIGLGHELYFKKVDCAAYFRVTGLSKNTPVNAPSDRSMRPRSRARAAPPQVLEKNLLNCCVSTIGWWAFGWAFAHAGCFSLNGFAHADQPA